jgi:hypothetical protein
MKVRTLHGVRIIMDRREVEGRYESLGRQGR